MTACPTSIFNIDWVQADASLVETFVRGGYMPSASGTYEEGIAYQKMIGEIHACVIG